MNQGNLVFLQNIKWSLVPVNNGNCCIYEGYRGISLAKCDAQARPQMSNNHCHIQESSTLTLLCQARENENSAIYDIYLKSLF